LIGRQRKEMLMQPIWRKHLIICLFLGLLTIPIYFLDVASTADGGGGNWITLDFKGLIFWTYIAFLAIDFVLSSIGVLLFPKSAVLGIHFCSIVFSVILLVTGVVVYGKFRRAQINSDHAERLDREIAEQVMPFARSHSRREAGAGMEPAGAERHRRSPKGELSGDSESIEPAHGTENPVVQLTRACCGGGGGNRTRE
jgi:hypothetical protein